MYLRYGVHGFILSGRHGRGLAHADFDPESDPVFAGDLRVAAAVGAVAGLDGGIVLVGVGFAEEDPQRPIEPLTIDFPLAGGVAGLVVNCEKL